MVDQEFVELFEQNITFQDKNEELKYWKGIAYVESPNNGHIGDWTFVRCREMSASRRLLIH